MTTIKVTCPECREHVDLAPDDVIVLHNAKVALWPHCGNVQERQLDSYQRLLMAIVGCQTFDGDEVRKVLA